MNIKFQAPKGTQDILPEQTKIWQKIENIAYKTCASFNFNEIRIPTFENENLFNRSVGSSTDIVNKEMFKFTDLAGRPLALRPEGTSCVMRAILEHGLINEPMPLKLFYIISCFRNERPQTGRFKEFHQFGLELIGSQNASSDIEIIVLMNQFFEKLKITNLNLEINSIGCQNCRQPYKQKLIQFFQNKNKQLCENCIVRLEKNPLRILDCKNETCIELSKNAPKITEGFLCQDCANHFEQVCHLLKKLQINFEINPFLVRGLDYYTKTVFEFKSNKLGAQNTICGGGRYDSLVQMLSNHHLPALGCAVGLERLLILLEKQNSLIMQNKNYCCIFIGNFETTIEHALKLVLNLRKLNLNSECNLINRSVKAQMKYANKINSIFSCIVGEDEVATNKIKIKNMLTKQTFTLNLDNFCNEFVAIWQKEKIV